MVLIAAAQMCSSSNLAENGIQAAKLIIKAASMGCKLIILPEAADYIASNATHSKTIVQPFETSPFVLKVKDTLRDLYSQGKYIDVAMGIHEPSNEPNGADGLSRTKNTLVYLNSAGELIQRYQKLHLFDVDIPGGAIMKESNSVQPGMEIPQPVDSPVGKLGLAVCYDLRFPQLGLKYRSLGAEIITFPSAWTMKTGHHFQPLGVATAIFTQSYVILPAQGGQHRTGVDGARESYGHTCIIDPNGTILAQCSSIAHGEEGDLCVADIDLNSVQMLRDKMPLLQQRRTDILT